MSELQKIFKSYDIRGEYPHQLTKEIAYSIGRAFVQFLKVDTVGVGYDMRTSSPELKEAVLKGISDEGAHAIDLGLCSTDLTYYVSGEKNIATIMITASHNPKQYNGFKFCKPGALALSYAEGLGKIKEMLEKGIDTPTKEGGSITSEDHLSAYIETLLSYVGKENIPKKKVVVDAGNGMAGKIIPELEKHLPQLEIIPLYFELDGTFPNHPANPIEPENVADLQAKVKEVGADLGLAFDGDADRVFLIDETGESVSSSLTGAMVAKAILSKQTGTSIIHSVVCGWIVPETIKKYGGIPVETKVGHSIIKPIMKENDALFGTEHSGHFYFKDLYFADSGLLASLYVLSLITEGSLSSILDEFRVYFAIPETNSKVDDKDVVLQRIIETYKERDDVVSYKDFDGIRIDFEDWWFNVRPSNTEPLLRLNLEANSPELRKEKLAEVLSLIRK